MRSVSRKHKYSYMALYGAVAIEKAYCKDCEDYSFVLDGKLVCCDKSPDRPPWRYRRVSEPEQHRKLPKIAARRAKLEEQEHRCLYCRRAFDSIVYRKGKPVRLRLHWDHMVPYAYGRDNHDANFAASCHICNHIKSDHCFQTVEEAQIYLAAKWEEKGIV